MKAYTKLAAGVALALGVSAAAQADTIAGLYIGGQIWDIKSEAAFANPGNAQTSLNIKDELGGSVWAKLEHPVPLVPNVMVRYNQMDSKGDTELGSDFEFNDVTFAAGSSLNSDLKLTHADIVLYYELLDMDTAWFDLGLNFKTGNYKATMTGTADIGAGDPVTQSTTVKYSGVVPTVYAAAGAKFPFTGIGVFADVSGVSYSGTKLYDAQAGLSWSFIDNVAVEAQVQLGYRIFDLRSDDFDGVDAETTFKGAFAGVQFHF